LPTDIIGMREDDARSRLEDLGLKVSTQQVDGQGEQGTVSNTSPGPGNSIAVNGTVTLQITRGNQSGMPDLREFTESDAKKELRDAGVKSSDIRIDRASTDDPNKDGRVIDQSPSPGSDVKEGSQVTVVIGEYN